MVILVWASACEAMTPESTTAAIPHLTNDMMTPRTGRRRPPSCGATNDSTQEPAALPDFNPAFVRFGSSTTKGGQSHTTVHVRFTPESGQIADIAVCPLCAKSRLMHRSKKKIALGRRLPAVISRLLRHALGRCVGRQGDPGVA